jgi:hypothetical protein
MRHLAKLEYHEGIGRCIDRSDNRLHLSVGNSELRADARGKTAHVGPGLYVQIGKKPVKPASGKSR